MPIAAAATNSLNITERKKGSGAFKEADNMKYVVDDECLIGSEIGWLFDNKILSQFAYKEACFL